MATNVVVEDKSLTTLPFGMGTVLSGMKLPRFRRGRYVKRNAIALGLSGMVGAAAFTFSLGTADARSPMPVSDCPVATSVEDADIVYLGQYGGAGATLPYSFRGAGHTTKATKVVGSPIRPTYFVVSAYEPTVWDFSAISPKMIAGVHASGFYEQGVTGVPSSKPVTLRHVAANNAEDPTALKDGCLDMGYKYQMTDAGMIGSKIKTRLGKLPKTALMSYATPFFDLDLAPDRAWNRVVPTISAPGYVRSENPVDENGLQPGEPGLKSLVDKGILLPLANDMAAGYASRGQLVPEGRIARMNMDASRGLAGGAAESVMLHNPYLVMRSVDRLPDGLFGAHSATFIMLPGVKAPVDMDSHSSFFRYTGPEFDLGALKRSFAKMAASLGQPLRMPGYMTSGNLSSPMTRVDWDENGQMRLQAFGPQGQGNYNPAAANPNFIRPPVNGSTQYVQVFPDATWPPKAGNRAMKDWPIMLIGIGGIVFLMRKRIFETWHAASDDSTNDKVAPGETHEKPVEIRTDPVVTTVASPDAKVPHHDKNEDTPSPIAKIMSLTSNVIDATENDAAIGEVSRLRRDLAAAVGREWDHDIAGELEALVGHCSAAAAEYVVLRVRADAISAAAMEVSMLEATRIVRSKLVELTAQQGRRDAGSIATQHGFIRRRHGPDELGSRP
jgi:hypothetical protein